MRRKVFFLSTVIMAMIACGDKSVFSSSAFETDEVKVTRIQPIADEENAPQCEMHLQVTYLKGTGSVARNMNNAIAQKLFRIDGVTMRQAVDSFVSNYVSEYQKSMAALYREDRNNEIKKGWYEYRYSIKTETETGHRGCMVYRIDLDVFEGGAHGIRQQLVLNLNPKTGRPIQLTDIFVEGFEYPLDDLLLEELMRQTHTKTLDELHEQDYLISMDIYAPQNFILGSNDITFIYNPYEIAPYVKGNTELTIPYSRLEKLLRKDF